MEVGSFLTNKDDNLGSNDLQDLGVPHSRKPPLRYPLTMLMDVNQQKRYDWEVVPAIILEISSNQHVASAKNYGTLTSQLTSWCFGVTSCFRHCRTGKATTKPVIRPEDFWDLTPGKGWQWRARTCTIGYHMTCDWTRPGRSRLKCWLVSRIWRFRPKKKT